MIAMPPLGQRVDPVEAQASSSSPPSASGRDCLGRVDGERRARALERRRAMRGRSSRCAAASPAAHGGRKPAPACRRKLATARRDGGVDPRARAPPAAARPASRGRDVAPERGQRGMHEDAPLRRREPVHAASGQRSRRRRIARHRLERAVALRRDQRRAASRPRVPSASGGARSSATVSCYWRAVELHARRRRPAALRRPQRCRRARARTSCADDRRRSPRSEKTTSGAPRAHCARQRLRVRELARRRRSRHVAFALPRERQQRIGPRRRRPAFGGESGDPQARRTASPAASSTAEDLNRAPAADSGWNTLSRASATSAATASPRRMRRRHRARASRTRPAARPRPLRACHSADESARSPGHPAASSHARHDSAQSRGVARRTAADRSSRRAAAARTRDRCGAHRATMRSERQLAPPFAQPRRFELRPDEASRPRRAARYGERSSAAARAIGSGPCASAMRSSAAATSGTVARPRRRAKGCTAAPRPRAPATAAPDTESRRRARGSPRAAIRDPRSRCRRSRRDRPARARAPTQRARDLVARRGAGLRARHARWHRLPRSRQRRHARDAHSRRCERGEQALLLRRELDEARQRHRGAAPRRHVRRAVREPVRQAARSSSAAALRHRARGSPRPSARRPRCRRRRRTMRASSARPRPTHARATMRRRRGRPRPARRSAAGHRPRRCGSTGRRDWPRRDAARRLRPAAGGQDVEPEPLEPGAPGQRRRAPSIRCARPRAAHGRRARRDGAPAACSA